MPRVTKKAFAQERIRESGWERIGQVEWEILRQQFSDTLIRTAAHEMGLSSDQPYAGVATKTLDELDSSLVAMADAYATKTDLRRACREVVIATKDRTRFAALNPKTEPAKRKVKEEMVERMLVWLGDPAMFGTWAALRNRSVYWSSSEST